MPLAGGGCLPTEPAPAGAPSRRPRRSASAQELRSGLSDSASMTSAFFGGDESARGRDASADSTRSRDLRRRTSLSPSMSNGDTMREVLTHQAPLVSALRPPTDPTRGRWRAGLSPSMSAENLRGASADDADSDAGSNLRGRLGHSLSANNLAWASPRLSASGESPCVRPPSEASSHRSGRGSNYDPRAKPGSAASEASISMGRRSPRSAQDHLWRELFHHETDDRKIANLRGAGKAIGSRGKASSGIPWRQIPSYDSSGRLCETGDPHNERRELVKASGIGEKKRAQFSPRLEASWGVQELLAPVSENCENRPPPVQHPNSEAREAWLDLVKRRADAKFNQITSRPLKQKEQASSNGASDDTASELHYRWRSTRKSGSNAASDRGAYASARVEDSCPFQRDDSQGLGAKSVQSRSSRLRGLANPASNAGESAQGDAMRSAEKVVEARRDWQFSQEKCGRDDSVLEDASGLSKSVSQRSFLSRSASARSFSSTTVSSMVNPVHSVRPRAEGGQRPRWK